MVSYQAFGKKIGKVKSRDQLTQFENGLKPAVAPGKNERNRIKYKLRNDVHIQQVTCPVTLFHGTSDEVIYYGSSLKLEKHLGHRGQLVTIPGGHHNDLPESDVYRRALSEILR